LLSKHISIKIACNFERKVSPSNITGHDNNKLSTNIAVEQEVVMQLYDIIKTYKVTV
jgi:hypothetical protein